LEEILLKNVLILGNFTKRKISQGSYISGETVKPEEIILRNKGKLTLKYLYKEELMEEVAYIDFISGHYEAWTYSEGNRIRLTEKYDLIALETWLTKQGYKIVVIF
jgi:hypothetical protein